MKRLMAAIAILATLSFVLPVYAVDPCQGTGCGSQGQGQNQGQNQQSDQRQWMSLGFYGNGGGEYYTPIQLPTINYPYPAGWIPRLQPYAVSLRPGPDGNPLPKDVPTMSFMHFADVYLSTPNWSADMLNGYQSHGGDIDVYADLIRRGNPKGSVRVLSKMEDGYTPVGFIYAIGGGKARSTNLWGYAGKEAIGAGVDVIPLYEGVMPYLGVDTTGGGIGGGGSGFFNPVTAIAGLFNFSKSKQRSIEDVKVWCVFVAVLPPQTTMAKMDTPTRTERPVDSTANTAAGNCRGEPILGPTGWTCRGISY